MITKALKFELGNVPFAEMDKNFFHKKVEKSQNAIMIYYCLTRTKWAGN